MNFILTLLVLLLFSYLIIKSFLSKEQDSVSREKFKLKSREYEEKLALKDQKIKDLEADIATKLKKARNVHQRMLPEKLIEADDYFISDYYQPAEYIGGDYYNLFKIDHASLDPLFEQYLIYFFDVSGHGIDSTLLSIFVNESIENYFQLKHSAGENISTKDLFNYIDQRYQNENFPDDYLVCLFIGLLDKKKNILKYSSGGFHYPIFKLDRKSSNLEEIEIGGFPISTVLAASFGKRKEKVIDFKKDELLFLSTDGLLEQQQDDQIYYPRLKKLIKLYKFLPAVFLKEIIKNDFYNFINKDLAEDDITYLILERPDAEIENFYFKEKINKDDKNYLKIVNYFNEDLFSGIKANSNYSNLVKIYRDLILEVLRSALVSKLKVLNSQNLLMFSFETTKNKDLAVELLNKTSKLELLNKQKKDFLNVEPKKYFDLEKIYFSHNRANNRFNFLIFKKNFKSEE